MPLVIRGILFALYYSACTSPGGIAAMMDGQGPVFVNEPPPRLDFPNSNGGKLECSARGSPQPTIHWALQDNTAVPTVPGLRFLESNGTLIFPPFSAADFRPDVHRATYRCVATNAMGRLLSRDVRVKAVVIQDLDVDVSSNAVTRGNSAVLRCIVPTFMREYLTVTSWLQDRTFNIYPSSDGDGKFHMLPSGELLVLNAGTGDSYSTYECRVTHKLTGETKKSNREIRIQVTEPQMQNPPQFSDRLVSLETRRDELIILPCFVEGNPPPQFRWEFDDMPITESEQRYTAGGGSLLVLPRPRATDSGRYVCIASNSVGSSRLEIALLVYSPLTAHLSPSVLTAALGQPAHFQCRPSGHPVKTIFWMKDGQSLRSGTPVDILKLPSVTKEDQGMYQCFIKNEHDSAEAAGELRLGDTPPLLMYRFIKQTIQPGPSISLKCVASGNPTPNIRWALDGFPLPQNERFVIGQYAPTHGDVISHVNITSVHVEDGGTYQCTASNRVGEKSHSAQLNVYGLPHVRPMGEVSAVAGEALVISCPVAGFPIQSIKWFRGDRMLPINRRHLVFANGTLIVDKVQSGQDGDGGSYRCTAADKLGRSASGNVHVNVMVPPKITPFSFRMDLHLGERVGVQCVISKGDPPLTVVWLKDGSSLTEPESGTHSGVVIHSLDQFNSILTIEALARHHGGNYTCIASNAVAQTQHTASLSVNVPPAITPFSFGELSLGERVRVTCSVKRGDPPLAITWFKDSRPLDTDNVPDSDLTIIRDLEDFSSVLAIPHVQSKHSGNYTCMASNPAKKAEYTASLLVTVPPTWVVEPQNKAVKLGESAVLDCKVEGFPQPTIAWKRSSGSGLGQYRDISSGLLLNGSLLLESVRQEDQGSYLCEASNGIGVGLSAVVQLVVNAPVHFKVRSRKELVRRGGFATLQCSALGDQPISLTWRKEGSFIDFSDRASIKNTTSNEGLVSELTIRNMRSDDSGIYTCFARNHFGHDQTAIHLLVQDAPGKPTNVRIIEQSSRRVTLIWTPPQDGNSPITRYIVRYAPIQGDSWSEITPEVSVEGSECTGILDSLHPATTYTVQVLAENSLGAGDQSPEIRVTTEEEPPTASPRHITVEATTSSQLLVSWEPPPPDHWNGDILGHYVGYREAGNSEKTVYGQVQYNFSTVALRGTGKEETRLYRLKKFCKYGIVVQAFNKLGAGPLSPEIIAQTLEDVPEASPRQVQCIALSPESLQISWQPPPESLVHGIIQGYRLIYEPIAELQDVTEVQTKLTTALTTVLHGLLKYTNYSIELLAFTRVGDGMRSERIHCRTKEDVPEPPAGVKALLESPDSALVTWLPPIHPNGIILKYGVYIRILEGGHQVDIRTVQHPPGPPEHLRYQMQGLKKKHRYEFFVTAFTKVGEGQSTSVVVISPANRVRAGVASFGGLKVVAWKSDVTLYCQSVGIPEPHREWRIGDVRVNTQQPTSRIEIRSEGSLTLKSAQRNDQGEYTCLVSNEHGKDLITYHLLVQVPPSAPLLLATGTTTHSLQLQWKLGDDGGSPIRGFVIHIKLENGEWEEVRLEGTPDTYALTNLRCGTLYYIFLTAFNRVGSGASSQTLAVRTRGSVPLVPSASELLVINSTYVDVHLNIWPDGGCSMLYFVIEYATGRSGSSHDYTILGNNISPDKVYQLMGLSPATEYRLRITAYNSAGSTVTAYQFVTLNALGVTVFPSQVITNHDQRLPLHKDVKVVALSIFSSLALVLSIVALCFCIKRKSENERLPHRGDEVQATATQDNKHNIARREQYYATVRKLPPSPATLECIPEYSEDIRPYATFHVPSSSEETKLQTFLYREQDLSPGRKSSSRSRGDDYCRVRKARSRSSEDYDSYGSESDTEPGTSSRTESSNQLDEGVQDRAMQSTFHAHTHTHGHSRKNTPTHDLVYPDWSHSPAHDVDHRTHFQRRYYHPHQLK